MPEQMFPPGLYDHPLNDAINQVLANQAVSLHQLQPLDPAEFPQHLAFYLRQLNESAGQTVMHAHWHLIPRRKGDMPDPRGGVRGVIPSRMRYG